MTSQAGSLSYAQIARLVSQMRFNNRLMSEREVSKAFSAEFDRLQKKLVPLWKSIERFNQDPQTIVVVPSMSIDALDSGAVIQAYEERFLFLLLLLRQPRARLIYVTSRTILPSIIDYYLDLLPGVIPSHARQRLFLPSPMDGSARPLSEKLLERPRLIEHIRSLIMDPNRAHLVPFNTTNREKELALRLGIPMVRGGSKIFPAGNKERLPQNFHRRKCSASFRSREHWQQGRPCRCDRADAGDQAFDQTGDGKAE